MKNIIKDKMTINIEPCCPSNYGPLRISAELENGKIVKCTPHLGYSHIGIEKIAQSRLFSQYLPIVEKIDCTAGFFYSQAYISAVETLLEVEIPEKAKYIRVLIMELNRISSHLLWLEDFTQDLGAIAPAAYIFNLRNELLNIFKKITGSQITHNYYVFGGVRNDISNNILNDILDYINNFNKKFKIIEDIIAENPILIDRTRGLGIITSEIALPYSITGINLRANGLALDFRKEKPYLIYDKLEFTIPTAFEGDCYARFKLRIDETKISLNLVKQCIDWLFANESTRVNLNINQTEIKPKPGKAASWIESSKGLIICSLVTDGSEKPKRLKWRAPSFYAIQLLEKIAINSTLADFTVIYDSLDISVSEADR